MTKNVRVNLMKNLKNLGAVMADRADADMRKNQNNSLRAYIRLFLESKRGQRSIKQTDSAGPGVTNDPTQAGEPYDNYNIKRGVDIYSYWYKSPGDKATGGGYRPEDPAAYIGIQAPAAPTAPAEMTTTESDVDEDAESLEEID